MATDNVQRLNSYLKTKGIKLDYEEVRQQVEGYYLQYQYNIPSTNVQETEIYSIYIIYKGKAGRGQLEIKEKGKELSRYLREGLELKRKPIERYLGQSKEFHMMLVDFELQNTLDY